MKPTSIVTAHRRISTTIGTTPLELSRDLSARCGAEVFLKLECAQVTGSFKVRGALNAVLSDPQRRPVVACSAGNHGLGVAFAATQAGICATVVVPETASAAKVAGLRRYPIELIQYGANYDAAEQFALKLARERGWRFVSPYNDPDVIAGQGTLGLELLNQRPDLDMIVVGVGGGGLAAGVGLWAKALNPALQLIGVQPETSAAMHAALGAGRVVAFRDDPTLADGLAGGIDPDTITLPLLQQLLDGMILVSETEIAAAIRYMLDEHHIVIEGSAAVPLAALLHGKIALSGGQRVAALLCGRNISSETLKKVFDSA